MYKRLLQVAYTFFNYKIGYKTYKNYFYYWKRFNMGIRI